MKAKEDFFSSVNVRVEVQDQDSREVPSKPFPFIIKKSIFVIVVPSLQEMLLTTPPQSCSLNQERK